MKNSYVQFTTLLLSGFFFFSCANQEKADNKASADSTETTGHSEPKIVEEAVTYAADDITFHGYIAYDQHKTGKRPAILVVHEWWGLGDYERRRAKQLADLGYIAMAIDMYGDGKTAEGPEAAQKLAGPFYQNPQLTKSRLQAAINRLSQFEQVDTNKIAAIGYCYGGYVVLNAAKLGANLAGVVSFHGNLGGVRAEKALLKSKILVCHGEADKFVSAQEVAQFKKGMDSIGADYTFKSYAGATHAFTNPEATEKGKRFKMPIEYNEAADKASWNDMKTFLEGVFK